MVKASQSSYQRSGSSFGWLASVLVFCLNLFLVASAHAQASYTSMTATGGGTVSPPSTTVNGGIRGSVRVGRTGDAITDVWLYEYGNPNPLAEKHWDLSGYENPPDDWKGFDLSAPLTVGSHALYIASASFLGRGATSSTFTVNVYKASQSISFGAIGAQSYGGAWPGAYASASSGLPVSLGTATPSICDLSGSNIRLLATGTCTITADQAGNGSFNAAPQVSQSFVIGKANQSLTFNTIVPQVYGGASPTFSASANTGFPVTVSSQTPSICGIAGSNVTLLAAGTCTLVANQAGDGNYNAVQATQSFSIAKANQSVTFAGPSSAVVGTPIALSASATSGLGITFSSSTTGVCTIAGNTASIVTSGTCTITASQDGDGNFNAATAVVRQFPVNLKTQTISFGALAAKTYGDPAFSVSATSDSGLPVSFSAGAGSTCSVVGSTVTISGSGTCTVYANQGGNSSYAAASQVAQAFSIAKANQTITFAGPSGGTVGTPVALSASTTSGLAVGFSSSTTGVCTITGSTVNLLSSGTCTITASQNGDGNFNAAAAVTRQFAVGTKAQTITFAGLTAKTFGDPAFSVSASASSGMAVSFSTSTGGVCSVTGTTVTLLSGGTCTIVASQAGDTTWSPAAPVSQSFTVSKKGQTITFGALSPAMMGTTPTLAATASSGLAVAFGSATSGVCNVTGNSVTLLSTGLCTINANQSGDSKYLAATQVQQSFSVGASDAPVAINVSVPQESNPEGGTLPGNLGVSGSGSATYSIPIQLPPGIGGNVPSVSLNYDSNNTTGSAGLGWSLGGMTNIDRCGRVFATDGMTDTVRFVAPGLTTSKDRLCLDGQRLILVSTASATDADYWAVGAVYRTEVESLSRVTSYLDGNGKLAFEVKTKDGRTLTYGATPDSYLEAVGRTDGLAHRWHISRSEDRSGNFISYSYSEDAQSGESKPASISWGGNRILNKPHFAKVEFAYADRPDARLAYIGNSPNFERQILKTIKTSVDTSNDNQGTWVTALTYTLVHDQSPSSKRSMLTSVQACDGSGKCLPATTFAWGRPDPAAPRAFVALGGARQGPTIVDGEAYSGDDVLVAAQGAIVIGDFNGDGKADILERFGNGSQRMFESNADGTAWTSSTPLAGMGAGDVVETGDFDGDGLIDLLIAEEADTGYSNWRACLGANRSGSGLYNCGTRVVSNGTDGFPAKAIAPKYLPQPQRMVKDFNADGRDDIALRSNVDYRTPDTQWGCLSNGVAADGSLRFTCGANDSVVAVLIGDPNRNPTSVGSASADVDGDGRVDQITLGKCYWGTPDYSTMPRWICLNTYSYGPSPYGGIDVHNDAEKGGPVRGSIWYPFPNERTFNIPPPSGGVLTSDLNADGYSDIVFGGGVWGATSHTVPESFYGTVCFSSGICKTIPTTGMVNNVDRSHLVVTLGDFDGDGLVDVLRPTNDIWNEDNVTGYQLCHLRQAATGDVSQECEAWSGPTFYSQSGAKTLSGNYSFPGRNERRSMFLGDFNGDGKADIATFDGSTWQIYAAAEQARPGEALDKLISVTNGVGLLEKAIYANANDAGVYSPAATNPDGTAIQTGKLSYPTQKLVKSMQRANGRGGMLATSYKYYRLSQDAGGRGSLGFARVDSTDVQTGIVTSNWPWQVFPHIGAPHFAQVKSAGCVLSDSSEMRAVAMLGLGSPVTTPYSYVSQSVSVRKDLNCADLGRTTVTNGQPDAFGNILTSTSVSTSNTNASGYNVVKNMKYDNNWSAMRIGELREVNDTRTNNTGTVTRVSSYTYDGLGRLNTETREADLTTKLLTTYNRDGFGNVTQTIVTWRDPVSNTDKTRTIADVTPTANGRFPYTVKNAVGQVETKTFDARSGAPKSVTTANALTMSWDSDGFGHKTRAVAIDGTETLTMLKNCQANCPAGATTVAIQETKRGTAHVSVPVLVFADSAGHALRSVTWGFDGTKIATDTIYDDRGRAADSYWPRFVNDSNWLADGLSVATGAKISKHVEYDNLNRVTIVSTPDEQGVMHNSTTTYNGFTTTLVNPKLQSKSDTRDVWGKLESSLDANGKKTTYEHDAFGNLSKTTDPLNNVVVVKYDPWGRRTELNDPDMGKISYGVDPLGQVWRQVSAKQAAAGKATTMQYDDLGRMVSRVSQDATTSHSAVWIFDKKAGQVDCASFKSCGQLVESYTLLSDGVTKDNRRVMSFDSLGRPSMTTYYRDVTYNSTTEYDAWGRPSKTTHLRAGGTAKVFGQFYNGFGQLARIERQGAVLWTADVKDAAQQLKNATLGNGLKVTRDYYDYTGRLKAGQLLNASNAEVLKEGYNYDVLGNVSLRTQAWLGQTFNELFDYDGLNRLKTSALGSDTQNFVYDDIGNILTKTNVGGNGIYAYNAPGPLGVGKRPHAVSSIPNIGSFAYDENGNMTSGAGRAMTWTAFDMPATIAMGAESSSFVYGADYERTVQNKADGTRISYAGAMEVETKGANTTVKTYWPLQLGVEIEKGGATALSYTHADRLGSIVAITDASGNLVEKMAYDSWGKRRDLFDSGTPGAIDGVTDNKGYTGHEMLDQLDLVHMNGRVYDPLVARFLSADPLIQDPEHSQSYNRYSYVWNNPTNLTDPTGFATATNASPGPDGPDPEAAKKQKSGPRYACIDRAGRQVDCTTGALVTTGALDLKGCQGKDGSGGCTVVWRRADSANINKDDIVREALFNSPNPSVSQSSYCVGREGTCAAGLSSLLGGWFAATKLGQVTLAFFGLASEVQSMADGLPAAGRGIPNAETKAAENAANLSRELRIADLGIKGTVQELKGTFVIKDGVATMRVDMIRGEIQNPLQVVSNMAETAKASGATSLRIEGTIANEKLYNVLSRRYGLTSSGATDVITIPLK